MAISNGSSIKKTKVSNPEIDGYSIRFEWEGDKAKWIRYSEDLNCLLVETFISKKQKVLELNYLYICKIKINILQKSELFS